MDLELLGRIRVEQYEREFLEKTIYGEQIKTILKINNTKFSTALVYGSNFIMISQLLKKQKKYQVSGFFKNFFFTND